MRIVLQPGFGPGVDSGWLGTGGAEGSTGGGPELVSGELGAGPVADSRSTDGSAASPPWRRWRIRSLRNWFSVSARAARSRASASCWPASWMLPSWPRIRFHWSIGTSTESVVVGAGSVGGSGWGVDRAGWLLPNSTRWKSRDMVPVSHTETRSDGGGCSAKGIQLER